MSFLGKSDDKNVRLSNAHKYVETLVFNKKDDLDIAIAERINSRIIKDIQYQYAETSNSCTYSVMIIYDTWAEKARNEKENQKQKDYKGDQLLNVKNFLKKFQIRNLGITKLEL